MWILLLFQCAVAVAQTSDLSDTFVGYAAGTWAESSVHGPWVVAFNGYGKVGIQIDANRNRALFQKPKTSLSQSETYAALALTRQVFVSPSIVYRSKVVQQLRRPVPNPWETAWVIWSYKDGHHFYYFALKTNGWELGKVDNAKADANGPNCLWPTYANCKYPGAQRYLKTGPAPFAQIGRWQAIRVQQTQNSIVVYVGSQLVTETTDNDNPYLAGQVGLYNEDAQVQFDNVQVVNSR